MKKFPSFLFVVVVCLFCILGCAVSSPDPLAGWIFKPFPGWGPGPNGHNDNRLPKSITDDYQEYIAANKLSLADAIEGYYEDGTGRHAVRFDTFPPNKNATLTYVIIYDKEGKRSKVIKFGYRKYQS